MNDANDRMIFVVVTAILALFFIMMAAGVASAADYYVATTGSDVTGDGSSGNPWLTIQHAVYNASVSAGDTIYIYAGTYTENVNVNKTVTIIGAGAGVTIVKADDPNDHILNITNQKNVTLEGFEIRDANGTTNDVAGILMANVSECTLSDIVVTNISATGDAHGLSLENASECILSDITVTNISATGTADGVVVMPVVTLSSSDNNRFTNLSISYINANHSTGIGLGFSNSSIYSNTTIAHISGSYHAYGIFHGFSNSSIFSNTTISHVTAEEGNGIYQEAYGIYLHATNQNTFDSNTSVSYINATNTTFGILLEDSLDNTFNSTTVSDITGDGNAYGIFLSNEWGNCLTNNNGFSSTTVSNISAVENAYGIELWGASNNTFNSNSVSTISAGKNAYGIFLLGSPNSSFSSTAVSNISAGKNAYGIRLRLSLYVEPMYSSNCTFNATTVSHISATYESNGIYVGQDCNNNTLTSTTVENVTSVLDVSYGIYLAYSSADTLINSTMLNNGHNFRVEGDFLATYLHSIDTSNTVDGKPIYYWVDKQNQQIPGDAGFVGVVNSTNITVKDVTLTHNGEGVLLAYTKQSRIENVTASDNIIGIELWSSANNIISGTNASNNYGGVCLYYSHYNTIANSTASANNEYGMYLDVSINNTIYNNYFNNTNNAYDDSTNRWNVTKRAGPNILGGAWIGGNYFTDYTGSDTDYDGLGNTPYSITGGSNQDHLPLVPPLPVHNVNKDLYYGTIQAAIKDANQSDTITVAAGTYTENVDVNKSVTLIGAGADVTIVNASSPSDHVFDVTANHTNITGFTVQNATGLNKVGIYLDGVNHCNVSNNNATNNYYGLWLSSSSNNNITDNTANNNTRSGIVLYESSNNTLTGNTANNNVWEGIALVYSSNSTLTNNTASNNTYYGIALGTSSSNNTLRNNTMAGNTYNFRVSEDQRSYLIHDIDTSNTVDGKPIYYWINQHDQQIPEDAGFVGIIDSTNITVKDVTITHNGWGVIFFNTSNSRIENVTASNNKGGIYLVFSNNSTISGNTVSNITDNGIYLYSSSNSTLSGNTANSNNDYGIYLHESSNNVIYHNNLIANTENGNDDDPSNNSWHHPVLLEGNYWSDYSGVDDGSGTGKHAIVGDGIGDTDIPHPAANYDDYPFMNANLWATNPPSIIAWYNSKTNNNATSLTITTSESVSFSATANQSITNWHWYKDNVYQNWNYDDITLSWSTAGSKTVKVKATNANGTSMEVTWSINVQEPTRRSGSHSPRDSDGDGYSDIEELLAGTDPNDPNDYPYKPATTPTATTKPAPTVTPTVPLPKPTPAPSPTEAPTPTPEEPGFEAVFAIAGLLTVAYILRRGC